MAEEPAHGFRGVQALGQWRGASLCTVRIGRHRLGFGVVINTYMILQQTTHIWWIYFRIFLALHLGLSD